MKVAIDFQGVLVPKPSEGTELKSYFKSGDYLKVPPLLGAFQVLILLRARAEGITILSKASEPKFVRSYTMKWLVHWAFLLPSQASDLVLVSTDADKGRWCLEHHVTHFIDNDPRAIVEVLLVSTETTCYLFNADGDSYYEVERLWEERRPTEDFPFARLKLASSWSSVRIELLGASSRRRRA